MAGALVRDSVRAADGPAGGRAIGTALGAPHAVGAEVLVEETMFSGRTSNPVAGACVSEGGQTRLHGHTASLRANNVNGLHMKDVRRTTQHGTSTFAWPTVRETRGL